MEKTFMQISTRVDQGQVADPYWTTVVLGLRVLGLSFCLLLSFHETHAKQSVHSQQLNQSSQKKKVSRQAKRREQKVSEPSLRTQAARQRVKVRVQAAPAAATSAAKAVSNSSDSSESQVAKGTAAPTSKKADVLENSIFTMKARSGKERAFSFGSELGYGVTSDLQDQAKPRLYSHSLSAMLGLQHESRWSLSLSLDAQYYSLGERNSSIQVNSDQAELFLKDVTLGVQKIWLLASDMDISWSVSNEFPTSPLSRAEKVNSITHTGINYRWRLWPDRASWSHGIGGHYIWNTYDTTVGSGEPNRESGTRYGTNLSVRIWDQLFADVGLGVQLSRYVDGSTDWQYRNSIGVGYRYGALNFRLGMSNGTYADQSDADLWWVDEYRRLVSFSIRYFF